MTSDASTALSPLIAAAATCSLGASTLGTWLMMHRGRRLFLDVPNERSAHTRPTPRGGGIVFVTTFFVAISIFALTRSTDLGPHARWIPVALLPLVLVGVVDDLRGLAPALRFLAQMLTACLVIILLGAPLPTFISHLGVAATALLVLLVTIPIAAAINFANFMDGLDGLVAGMATIQLAFLGWWLDVPVAWLMLAPLIGFLIWNWPPARIFMGDTGSTFLGVAPIMLGILSDARPSQVVAAWVVTAPLHVDALVTLVRRAARGANVLQGHREHLYQRLQQIGWSHRRVTLTYMAATLMCAALIVVHPVAGPVTAVVITFVGYAAGDRHVRRRRSGIIDACPSRQQNDFS